LAHYYIKNAQQVLILVPEIILWNQVGERFKEVFWEKVIIINSLISAATKTKYWQDIHSWDAKLIIGTRSSLFYPYKDLALIIQDEEHDSSYISDNSPRYRSTEVIQKISSLLWIKVIYASGTPSVEKMYQAKKWESNLKLLSLLEKYK
jgi:primosomal protein N' (replication factor Y)